VARNAVMSAPPVDATLVVVCRPRRQDVQRAVAHVDFDEWRAPVQRPDGLGPDRGAMHALGTGHRGNDGEHEDETHTPHAVPPSEEWGDVPPANVSIFVRRTIRRLT